MDDLWEEDGEDFKEGSKRHESSLLPLKSPSIEFGWLVSSSTMFSSSAIGLLSQGMLLNLRLGDRVSGPCCRY